LNNNSETRESQSLNNQPKLQCLGNIKYGKPGSIEAAIVMLSDSVEATISYIVKSKGNKYTTDKIIDNIFQMRMDKGTFDSCPLQIKEFKKLRDFFIKEYADTHI
jgi:membrane-associated HD superfamily phosphohydrolase